MALTLIVPRLLLAGRLTVGGARNAMLPVVPYTVFCKPSPPTFALSVAQLSDTHSIVAAMPPSTCRRSWQSSLLLSHCRCAMQKQKPVTSDKDWEKLACFNDGKHKFLRNDVQPDCGYFFARTHPSSDVWTKKQNASFRSRIA